MEAPTLTTPDVPPFATAVSQLQEFLGNPETLSPPVWVFREDVASVKWRIWVRTPLPERNPSRAEVAYEAARSRGLGVALQVLCLLDFEPCCYVCWPRDEMESQYMMLTGQLRLSIPWPLLAGNSVENSISWWYRKWQERRCKFPSYVDRIPKRDDK